MFSFPFPHSAPLPPPGRPQREARHPAPPPGRAAWPCSGCFQRPWRETGGKQWAFGFARIQKPVAEEGELGGSGCVVCLRLREDSRPPPIYRKRKLISFTHLPQDKCPKNFVFIIKPCSTNLKSKQKTGNKQHEVFPPKGRVQSSANKLNVKL